MTRCDSIPSANIQSALPQILKYLVDILISEEGATQGDPLVMPMYALATISLLKQLPTNVEQIWYADNACVCGKLGSLYQ